jgi:hypothetical protein
VNACTPGQTAVAAVEPAPRITAHKAGTHGLALLIGIVVHRIFVEIRK